MTGIFRTAQAAATAVALAALATSAAAQSPRPQLSVEQLQRDFAQPAPPDATGPNADDTCEAQGMVTGADGSCEPLLEEQRGFDLVGPERGQQRPPQRPPVGQPRPGPVAGGGQRPPRPPQQRPRPQPQQQAQRGRDLLITFVSGSATLTEQAKSNARVFAQALQTPALAAARFAIDGHTDAVGSRESNVRLSQARAEALVSFLTSLGVDRSRFDVAGHGFDKLLRPDRPRSAENRRVEARRVS